MTFPTLMYRTLEYALLAERDVASGARRTVRVPSA